ncbi:phosphotyrosine protein phosphatase [Micrococcus sp.]|uniref:arsenate reductase/protein-tyrosine-phosphatase family protein n=1 Tax=Micrococcus sp. TaxID=1271 RepID=UPI002A91370C|nr:phosphotyrosine protein phosphatase [Micrococcus sp.]MDY6054817.1 phosphotyrosine protein phosphatase [Micrococcus sp.]
MCTGNICRSAWAEHSLQTRLDAVSRGVAEAGSAGTHPNQALTVPGPLLALGEQSGIAGLGRHRPAQLTTGMIDQSALVLAATQEHMRAVLRAVPGAVSRTYTVTEFAALVRAMDERAGQDWFPGGAGVGELVRAASRSRAVARSTGVSLDVPDPFGGPAEGYAEMVELLEPALETIAGALVRAVSGSAAAPLPAPR